MKAKVVVFNTEYTGKMQDAESDDDGKIIIENSEWDVERVKPILIEMPSAGGFIRRKLSKSKHLPFYFMKQSTALPVILVKKEENQKFNVVCECGKIVATYPVIKKTVEPLDLKTYKTMLSPKMQKETGEMRFLKILKTYSEPKKVGMDKKMMTRVLLYGALAVGGLYIASVMGLLKF
jgi:hypothetical protein